MIQIDTLYGLLQGNVSFELEPDATDNFWDMSSDTRVLIGACLSSGDTFLHSDKTYCVTSKTIEEDFLIVRLREVANEN